MVVFPEPTPAIDSDLFVSVITEAVASLEELMPQVEEREYAAAIARELERLAVDLEGVELVPVEAQEHLRQLMLHANAALADSPVARQGFAENMAAATALLARQTSSPSSPLEARESASEPTDSRASYEDRGMNGEEVSAVGGHDSALSEAKGRGGRELMYAREVLEYDPSRSEYNQVVPEIAELRETLERMQAQYVMPIGEAEGEQAGVFANDEVAADGHLLAGQDGEEFLLPAAQEASRTIRVRAPVAENLTASEYARPAIGEWRRLTENVILPERIPHEYREVVSRYFARIPAEDRK
ncbi:MAG TPA: hypothetical protein VF168_12830 [Trueperaceae bacterium]